VTELAREQPLDGSLTAAKSVDASAAMVPANSGVLPSPDVLNSLDMIHSWLQQSETHTETESEDMSPCASFSVATSQLPLAALAQSHTTHLASTTSSWQTATVNIATVRCFMIFTSCMVTAWIAHLAAPLTLFVCFSEF